MESLNKKVIVADDDPQILKGLTMALGDLGYQVSYAENGKRALDLILKNTPDLLITDFDMSKLNLCKLVT